jgi:hypothetical protein
MPAARQPLTLEYRSGVAGERTQHVLRELMSDESMSILLVAGKVALGLPLCLVGPLIVTAVLEWPRRWQVPGDFGPTFLVISCITLPLLMWLERRTRGEFLWKSLDAVTPGHKGWDTRPTPAGADLAAVVELALFGPRLLWSVIDWFREREPVDPVVRVTAAHIALELYDANNSRTLMELVRPDRPPAEVIRAANYLVRCGWTDLYRNSQRLRLRGFVRSRLTATLNGFAEDRAAGQD